MKVTHIFTHEDVEYTLEWNQPSGKFRVVRAGVKESWTEHGYSKRDIESCGWSCRPISFSLVNK